MSALMGRTAAPHRENARGVMATPARSRMPRRSTTSQHVELLTTMLIMRAVMAPSPVCLQGEVKYRKEK